MGTTAIVAGATGLVGGELVQCLLESPYYNRVIILVRKITNLKHDKLIEIVVDYENLDAEQREFDIHQTPYYGMNFEKAIVFCVLGTTMKIAQSKEAFRKVDYQYPLQLAELAQKHGAEQFHVVTAMGSNPDSTIFYSQVKGQLEIALKQLNLQSLHIYHPSLILGNRTEFRFGERIGTVFMRALSLVLVGGLRKYKAIHARTIAQGMMYASQKKQAGTYLYEYNDITKFARKI
jgi:uncharacterized protein YbjT (DUF2867 family)